MGKIVENEKKKYEDILTYQFSFFVIRQSYEIWPNEKGWRIKMPTITSAMKNFAVLILHRERHFIFNKWTFLEDIILSFISILERFVEKYEITKYKYRCQLIIIII